jgi:hypothetical protein
MTQDYDEFDIDLFYDFCRKNPMDGSAQDYIYPFINLTNVDQKEMDKFVIGSWVQNHRSEDVINQEMNEKITSMIFRKEGKSWVLDSY